jgi:hypothetical protein
LLYDTSSVDRLNHASNGFRNASTELIMGEVQELQHCQVSQAVQVAHL